jgi:hypothetical protein
MYVECGRIASKDISRNLQTFWVSVNGFVHILCHTPYFPLLRLTESVYVFPRLQAAEYFMQATYRDLTNRSHVALSSLLFRANYCSARPG